MAELVGALEAAGLDLVSFAEPLRYDPLPLLPDDPAFRERVKRLPTPDRWALAERLAGNIRTHVAYAAKAGRAGKTTAGMTPDAVPRLAGLDPAALARQIQKRGALKVTFDGLDLTLPIPREAAPLAARLDGRAPLGAVAKAAGLDWLLFAQRFGPLHRALTGANLMRYSRGMR